ncbi:two-component system regulatory protein YycI [Thalassobacillus pellis]|uniref:two-component system regulatory protein YycI n=1 Tax=Thalassobacillus pellis TaxID=748008 RepID=UPI0019620D00|nr:two-component system regulatory protein YycI [Thalassobacillus pellis]MBM7552172.1 regulatory protein YycI of two-component signal transduction system YycFG [Thalassobacillus pellis]
MQWGQIKTIFILSFLVLDLFLLGQFLGKIEVDVQSANDNTTIKEQLDLEDIDYSSVPETSPEVSLMNGRRADFSQEDMKAIKGFKGITPEFVTDNLLYVQFDEAVPIEKGASGEEVLDKVEDVTIYSDQYSYWGWNKDLNVILFFQKSNDKTIYYNESGLLMYIVEDGAITGYYQTRLGNINIDKEKELSIPPIQAVYQLYDTGYITSGDKVTDMKIGYHSKIQPEPGEDSGVQVFAPTWKVTVNGEEDHFVNAREGTVVEIAEDEFVVDALKTIGVTTPITNQPEGTNGEEQSAEEQQNNDNNE